MSIDEKYECECMLCNEIFENIESQDLQFSIKFYINRINNKIKWICDHCLSKLREALNLNKLNERINNIENSIQQHAYGVQNVYNEFNEIKRSLNLDPLKELSKKLKKMIKELES